MKTYSSDGTAIAYDKRGSGPTVVLVDGALCTRSIGPGRRLARQLEKHFTVLNYDRRGRGDSGDTDGYSVAREVDDLRAVIHEAGGEVAVFGQSSGAVLALYAAAGMPEVRRLAVYEAPFVVDGTRPPTGPEYERRLNSLIAAEKEGAAVKLFLEQVGLPAPVIAIMRITPLWPKLKALAPTLAYDAQVTIEHQQGKALGREEWAAVDQPTLVLAGGKSQEWMRNGMKALAGALPDATYRALERQTHNLRPKAVAPELVHFFNGPPSPRDS